MTSRINYDDNIFYLHALIKGLRGGLRLEIDPDYFRDKFVEDVFFVDRTLQQLLEALKANRFLINRGDHLRELLRVKRAFCDFLKETTSEELTFPAYLVGFYPKLTSALEHHLRDLADIEELMEGRSPAEEPKNIVSQDEYRFLFQDDEPKE